MTTPILISLAAVIVLGVAAQWIAWRVGVPSILLLLLFGFLAGPVTGFLDPDALIGELLLPSVSLAVALILYEGGLTLSLAELPKVGGVVPRLVTVGAFVTWCISAWAAYWVFDLSPPLAVLLGAILVVTGPTVITPLLRHIRPTGPSAAILKWEGIVIDPIGALLAVLVFEAFFLGDIHDAPAEVARVIAKTVLAAGGLGLFAAGLLTLLIHKYWIPDFLQNAVSLMLVVATFAAANAIQHESGLFAATVMGMALANQKYTDVRHIVEFKENLRVLLISGLFIILAARLKLADLAVDTIVKGLIFVLVLVVVARPAAAMLCTWRSKLTRGERWFTAGVAPRGIVAAAVASVFALRLEEMGLAQGQRLVPITFMVIIGTVAIYGIGAPWLARLLGVADPSPQGFLFAGAGPWARALAKSLKDKGFRVLLVDTNWDNTAKARMAGLPTYTGSILAEYVLDDIDLGGIGRLIAATPNDWINVLTVNRFLRVFGRSECYQLAPRGEDERRRTSHKHLHGRRLFGEKITFGRLESLIASGAVVKATRLSEEFTLQAFHEHYGESAVPMMVLTEEKRIRVLTADQRREPKAGDMVIAVVQEPVGDRPTESAAKDKKGTAVTE